MFETLSARFEEVFSSLRSRGRLRPSDVDDAISAIRRALLEADVSLEVVSSFCERVRAASLGSELHKALNPAQQVLKIVHAELVRTLGGETASFAYAPRPPTVVLLVGLQGSGKTTAAAKLARWFRTQGRSPLLVGADLTRPAAVEQLRVLGAEVGAGVFSRSSSPVEAALAGLGEARRLGREVLICDSAGRQVVDEDLMDEIRGVSAALKPDYKYLVLDAMTGQEAAITGRTFHSTLGLDGVILTKLDGDARGGAALSVRGAVGVPVVFSSVGERPADLERFHPERMAGRILGMGDLLSLAERAEEVYETSKAEETAERMMKGRFTLEDFLDQLRQLRKMGGISAVLSHLPETRLPVASVADDRRIEAMICSMTPQERSQPEIIDSSRRRRIALGSGAAPAEVSALLKNFFQARQVMRRASAGSNQGRRRKAARKASRKVSGPPPAQADFARQLERLRNTKGSPLEWP